jgi:hypothetical protein
MDYIWIISAALIVLAFIAVQKRDKRYRHLQARYLDSQTKQRALSNKVRDAEAEADRLRRENMRQSRWKRRAEELEVALREAKRSECYVSSKRLEHLEDYLSKRLRRGEPVTKFVGTLSFNGTSTLAEKLEEMISSAEFEILIVSPWIKEPAWNRMSVHLSRFVSLGGTLKVFTRAEPSDFASGLADDISKEVERLGGEMISVRQLHAKLYVADRKEAIVASANLTRGGLESNCESGIWLSDPKAIDEICEFIDSLRPTRR